MPAPELHGDVADPEFRRARARKAAAARHSLDARITSVAAGIGDLTPDEAEAAVRRVVDRMPPLSERQRARLAVILLRGPGHVSAT